MLAYPYSDPTEIPDWFWSIVRSGEKSADKLYLILNKLPTEEIYKFEAAYGGAVALLHDDRFHDGRADDSEDAIDDITKWAVGQGKEYYMDVWNLTVRLPEYGPGDEHLNLAALEVYEDRFGDVPRDRHTDGARQLVM